ncbi:hypothetical protein L208DRAFT_1347080, partial [Tricholoma matsutake]
YIHTEDNQVSYYNAHRDSTGNHRYEQCNPQSFRISNIMQAQVSFIVVPVCGGKCKMLSVLQSIALLNRCFANVHTLTKA